MGALVSIDFLGENYLKVMELLLNGNYYLREISDETKLAPSSVHKIIQNLKKKGIIKEKWKKNRVFFEINYDSAIAREMIRTLFVNKILSSKSFKKLLRLKPIKVYLFGSASRGTLTQYSDIDMAAFFTKEPNINRVVEIRMGFASEFIRKTDLFTLPNPSIIDEKSESIKNVEKGILLYGK